MSSSTRIMVILVVVYATSIGQLVFADPIVADHSIVADYAIIPQLYIDSVKTMLVNIPGESHSRGYRIGCQLLEDTNSTFQVNIDTIGEPESYTDQYMRLTNATWGDVNNPTGWRHSYGEEDWYTSNTAVQRTINHLIYCNTGGFEIAAMGFGWCWDMTWHNAPGGGIDPVYQVRWAGSSVGGPDGDLRWGLDIEDTLLTDNHVCMATYLDATAQYETLCTDSGYPTQVFHTTGPVDGGGNTGENGYQRYLKHEYIRTHIAASTDGVLFDYADILNWSNDNEQNTTTWIDYEGVLQTYPRIHSDNMLDLDGTYTEDGDHIGQRGALRLAKALWWMLACIAGWDGNPQTIEEGRKVEQSTHSNGVRLLVSPNPISNSAARIQFSAASVNVLKLAIYDVQGRKIYEQTPDEASRAVTTAGTVHFEFTLEQLPVSGVYFAEVHYRMPERGTARTRVKIIVSK
jgi:hypothetical protein